ncbi:MAG TPA: hypothetical protein PLG59_19660 [bacterium]|nr:hypothetical protein [bacterium]
MDKNELHNRRRFLAKAAAGSVAIGAVQTVRAENRNPNECVRIGCLNVGTYSHLPDLWAPLLNPRPEKQDIPFTNMRITHCWDIEPEKADEFAQIYRCEKEKNFDEMLGKVDAVISGGYYNHPWNHILHEPYLEAGLPNLINRPFSNALRKARKMVETARKHGATILAPSSHEHNDAISRARTWVPGRKIISYNAVNSFDDYPTHGVHGIYMICRAIAEGGNPVVSVSYRSERWWQPPGVMILEHQDPEGRRFYGTLHQIAGSWGTVRIHTEENSDGEEFRILRGTGYPYDKTEIWAPTPWAFQKMVLYGEMPQTFEQIMDKTNVFLAGWRSILEKNGEPVRLEDVPEDWESPVELPNHPNDSVANRFRQLFG